MSSRAEASLIREDAPASGTVEAQGRAADAAGLLRRLLLLVLVLGMVGTGVELFLLEHYETVWQWTPIALFGAGLVVTLTVLFRTARTLLRVFQAVMLVFVAAGLLGLYLHYRGNAEFELEMVPELGGWLLFWKSIRGATPALAPGTMIWLGLLGLATTFRHPLLRRE